LVYTDDGETLTIVDRREASTRTLRYSGWKRDLYLCCDAGRRRPHVEKFGKRGGATSVEIRRFLAELLESGLLVEFDGRCTALAVRVRGAGTGTVAGSSDAEERVGSI
jgi:hypothetical protein